MSARPVKNRTDRDDSLTWYNGWYLFILVILNMFTQTAGLNEIPIQVNNFSIIDPSFYSTCYHHPLGSIENAHIEDEISAKFCACGKQILHITFVTTFLQTSAHTVIMW